ncbi:hypothetical protein I316_02589 [Kwoniella heveanensis BCC8398]|uniref:Uncharacterized protein n=1 Tax=Kwoniella heveanensis BCC8398 TaxID=1296120 RepID=A0A1B9GWY0_9TREE|nr:hypothetical protein I316_02589 [Kwoniella heveanensis BCC8398]
MDSSTDSRVRSDSFRPARGHASYDTPQRSREHRRSTSPDWAGYFARTRRQVPRDRTRSPHSRDVRESSSRMPDSRNVGSSSSFNGSPRLHGNSGGERTVELVTPASLPARTKSLSRRLAPRIVSTDIIDLVSDSEPSDEDIVYVGRKSPEAWFPTLARPASPLDAPHIPSPERHDHSRREHGRTCACDMPYDETANLQRLRSNEYSGPLMRSVGNSQVDDGITDRSLRSDTPPDTPPFPSPEPGGTTQDFGQISPYLMLNMFRDDTIRSHRLDALHRNLGLPPVNPEPEYEPMIVGEDLDVSRDQLVYSPLVITDGFQEESHPPWQSAFTHESIVIRDDDPPAMVKHTVAPHADTDDGSEPMDLDLNRTLEHCGALSAELPHVTAVEERAFALILDTQ